MQNKIDTQVQQYIERAKEIEDKITVGYTQETYASYIDNVIEIAKMIQAQEHFEAQHLTKEEDNHENE